MSTLAALTTLLLFSGSAIAQISAPPCSSTSYSWTFNTLNQSPCTVAAYLGATCNMGSFTLATLQPGWVYYGPSGIDDADLCKCNTVSYSLLSACGGCQGDSWLTWSEYTFNCSKVLPPSTFPNPVPAGTRVPQWALLDVTLENSWDNIKSMATGDNPEIASGGLIGNPGSATTAATPSTPTGSSTGTSSADPFPFTSLPPLPSSISVSFGSNLNVGAVVGGSVGGITVIAITIFAIFYMRRQRRPKAPSAAFVIDVDDSSQSHKDEVKPLSSDGGTPVPSSTAEAPLTPMRLYDPDDPTTFPGYQAALLAPEVVSQTTFSPYSATADTMHSSGPPGYHGLPTV